KDACGTFYITNRANTRMVPGRDEGSDLVDENVVFLGMEENLGARLQRQLAEALVVIIDVDALRSAVPNAELLGLHRRVDQALGVGFENIVMALIRVEEHLAAGIGHRHGFLRLAHRVGALRTVLADPLRCGLAAFLRGASRRYCDESYCERPRSDHSLQAFLPFVPAMR